MKLKVLFISLFIVLSLHLCAFAGEYWIKVQNSADGNISISTDKGESWKDIGNVIVPINNEITEPTQPGFTAAEYGHDSSVVASAVNAIHIKVSKTGKFSRIFSLLPVECKNLDDNYKSYHGSAIITDIKGEEGIFGKIYSPFIGNAVYLLNNGAYELLKQDYKPHIGDEIVIKAVPPDIEKPIKYIRIENKINGFVMIVYEDLSVNFVARVLKPVAGIGGFTGASLAGSNKIRANHPGVLEISTSKHFDELSPDLTPQEGHQTAFQIVPFEHTLEYPSEKDQYEGSFGYARTSPVYLILMPPGYVFVEDKRYPSTDKENIISLRETIEKERKSNPSILTDFANIVQEKLEIKDRDYSSVFGRIVSFYPEQNLYGKGFFFGGFFKAGTCDASIKRTGEKEFSPIPEYNKGKDLTIFKDLEEIKIYYTGY